MKNSVGHAPPGRARRSKATGAGQNGSPGGDKLFCPAISAKTYGNEGLLLKQASFDAAVTGMQIEIKALQDALANLDEQAFRKAVDLLVSCDRVMTCASGHSGIAAEKFAHGLCCVDKPAYFMSPAKAIHGGMGGLRKEDCMVMVSRGGKTKELLPIIDICKVKKAKLIALTENMESPLALAADVVVPMKIEREADKYNMQATASYVATIGLFDALTIGVMEETNYQKEEFALIHPGGAVGERLNHKSV